MIFLSLSDSKCIHQKNCLDSSDGTCSELCAGSYHKATQQCFKYDFDSRSIPTSCPCEGCCSMMCEDGWSKTILGGMSELYCYTHLVEKN